MKKLNTTQFRKKLSKLAYEELTELIIDSCKASPFVYEVICSRLDRDFNVINMDLMKKWMEIAERDRELILYNCFCTKCRKGVRIIDYTLKTDKFGLILVGKCRECGFDVVRCLEE